MLHSWLHSSLYKLRELRLHARRRKFQAGSRLFCGARVCGALCIGLWCGSGHTKASHSPRREENFDPETASVIGDAAYCRFLPIALLILQQVTVLQCIQRAVEPDEEGA